jgi:hypothetical protein
MNQLTPLSEVEFDEHAELLLSDPPLTNVVPTRKPLTKSADGCSKSQARQASLRKKPSRNYSAAFLLLACSTPARSFSFFNRNG